MHVVEAKVLPLAPSTPTDACAQNNNDIIRNLYKKRGGGIYQFIRGRGELGV